MRKFDALYNKIIFEAKGRLSGQLKLIKDIIENDFIAENDINDLETSSDDENQPVGDINDLLSKEDNGTYTALQLKIALASEGSTLNLTNDYKYNDEAR